MQFLLQNVGKKNETWECFGFESFRLSKNSPGSKNKLGSKNRPGTKNKSGRGQRPRLNRSGGALSLPPS